MTGKRKVASRLLGEGALDASHEQKVPQNVTPVEMGSLKLRWHGFGIPEGWSEEVFPLKTFCVTS